MKTIVEFNNGTLVEASHDQHNVYRVSPWNPRGQITFEDFVGYLTKYPELFRATTYDGKKNYQWNLTTALNFTQVREHEQGFIPYLRKLNALRYEEGQGHD